MATMVGDTAPRAGAQSSQYDGASVAAPQASTTPQQLDSEKVLPLPSWLRKAYFVFPVVLYIPDALFNYYVYSDGGAPTGAQGVLLDLGFKVLWGFLAVGVVGMAYLLSVLAPWHWGQGHKIQAFFCGVGILIATAITTWNSLAYRSQHFSSFKTDEWIYAIWPQLRNNGFSLTMVLVAIAPPFWGLFWAIVQPTETGRNLRQLQESHAERLLRMQQEAELKRLKAETSSKVREAQLRGMAATAAAARQQASGFFAQRGATTGEQMDEQQPSETLAELAGERASDAANEGTSGGAQREADAADILRYPALATVPVREPAGSRGGSMMNHAAPGAVAAVHVAPMSGARSSAAQPTLLSDVDVQGLGGMPASDSSATLRRPPVLGGVGAFFPQESLDADPMTGTTGPRPAIRRATEMSALNRTMNEPLKPAHAQAVEAAWRELNPTGRKRVSHADLSVRVAETLNIDESLARKVTAQWMRQREAQRSARNS